jgi:hypothetical protein
LNIPEELIERAEALYWDSLEGTTDDAFGVIAEWARKEALKEAASAIEASTNPDGRYGSLNEGSRSQWFSKGIREASRRVWALLEGEQP